MQICITEDMHHHQSQHGKNSHADPVKLLSFWGSVPRSMDRAK